MQTNLCLIGFKGLNHSYFSIIFVGGIISSWLILIYWFSKFLSSSFWLCNSPVSLIRFWRDCSKSWYFPNDLSKTFHILKVLSGKTWVIFSQYFFPSLAIKSFFSRSDNCFNDFLVFFSSIFLRSPIPLIHSTRKSTTRTGSTLKSLLKSTFGSYSGIGASIFSTFFSYPFFFFFKALSSSSLASCYFLSFS